MLSRWPGLTKQEEANEKKGEEVSQRLQFVWNGRPMCGPEMCSVGVCGAAMCRFPNTVREWKRESGRTIWFLICYEYYGSRRVVVTTNFVNRQRQRLALNISHLLRPWTQCGNINKKKKKKKKEKWKRMEQLRPTAIKINKNRIMKN